MIDKEEHLRLLSSANQNFNGLRFSFSVLCGDSSSALSLGYCTTLAETLEVTIWETNDHHF